MTDCTPIFVAADQDRRHHLVADVQAHNGLAIASNVVPVDVNWVVDGEPIMFDIKTPADLVASVADGRLHAQMESMQQAGCRLYGFFITGDWSIECGRDEDTFDNEVLRLEMDGARIVRVRNTHDTGRRLASLWRWTRDRMDQVGSYHIPERIIPSNDLTREPPLVFFDRTFRSQVGMLMHLPDCGVVTANVLREQHSLMDILGISEEGLITAKTQVWAPTKGIGKKTLIKWEEYLRS